MPGRSICIILVIAVIFSGTSIIHYRFFTSAAPARVDTTRGILNLLVYLDISATGRMARINTNRNRDRSQIIHATPRLCSVAQSHEATRRCAGLNYCVALPNSPLTRRQVTATSGMVWMQSSSRLGRRLYRRSRKFALVDAGLGSYVCEPICTKLDA